MMIRRRNNKSIYIYIYIYIYISISIHIHICIRGACVILWTRSLPPGFYPTKVKQRYQVHPFVYVLFCTYMFHNSCWTLLCCYHAFGAGERVSSEVCVSVELGINTCSKCMIGYLCSALGGTSADTAPKLYLFAWHA
jgi:hypothetical protein